MQIGLFQGRTGRFGISICCLRAEFWRIATLSPPEPVKICAILVWFYCCLMVSWMQASLAFRTRCSGGPLSQVEVLTGVLDVGSKNLHSSGRSCEFWVPSQLYATVLEVRFVVRVCHSLSYLLPYGFFLICPICSSASYRISSRGNWSMCNCRFSLSMGGSEFRNLLCHYHGLEFLMLMVLTVSLSGEMNLSENE